MKFVVVFAALLAFAYAQGPAPETTTEAVIFDGEKYLPKTAVRDLPADVLRDFPGLCFASTLCRVFESQQSWPLTPFCGNSTCVIHRDGYLVERVSDCGIAPKQNPKCKIINEEDKTHAFPACCPTYQCAKGVTLEYPTPEELQASLVAQTLPPTPGGIEATKPVSVSEA